MYKEMCDTYLLHTNTTISHRQEVLEDKAIQASKDLYVTGSRMGPGATHVHFLYTNL